MITKKTIFVATVGGLMMRAERGLKDVASLLLVSIMCPEKLVSKETCRSQMTHCRKWGEVSLRKLSIFYHILAYRNTL